LIKIFSDNLKIVRAINKDKAKATECSTDRSVNEIKWLINKLHYTVKIEYQQKPKKKINIFNDNLLAFLL